MNNIQVTNKLLTVFFLPKGILLDTNTFSISTSFRKLGLIAVKFA